MCSRVWVRVYNLNIRRKRLLAKNMLLSINRLDSLFSVNSRCRSHNNGFQSLVLQHVIVVLVQLDAVRSEVHLGPFDLSIVRRTGSDQFCARSTFKEVQGMALAHTAETSAADSKF